MIDAILLDDWHPVAQADGLKPGQILPLRLLGADIILWRAGDKVAAWEDLCPHRGTPLSLGRVENDTLICGYHGWTYNQDGQCVRFPAHPTQPPQPTQPPRPTQPPG